MNLSWFNISNKIAIPQEELVSINIKPSVYIEYTTKNLIIELETKILAVNLDTKEFTETKQVEFTQPANWWEHFKLNYQNKFWFRNYIRRNPIKYKTIKKAITLKVVVNPKILFPECRNYPKNLGKPVMFVSYNSGSTDEHNTRSPHSAP